MIETNALLGIAYCIITNFTHTVPIPQEDVPPPVTELHHYHIGSPHSPIDVGIGGPHNVGYHVLGGVVQIFNSSQNFFQEQDPDQLEKYEGTSILTSNEVIELSSNVLQGLIKNGARLPNVTPSIVEGGFFNGKRIPFFQVEWPPITISGASRTVGAKVDVDGRTGKIVFLQLLDNAFLDFEGERQIMAQVYTPDPTNSPGGQAPARLVSHYPIQQDTSTDPPTLSTNDVTQAIKIWLDFDAKLGLDPGDKTNLADVNPYQTMLAFDPLFSMSSPIYVVTLSSQAAFSVFEGTIYISWAPDSMKNKGSVRGTIHKDWKELAASLENNLSEKLGIPKSSLESFTKKPRTKVPELSSEGPSRLVIDWLNPAEEASPQVRPNLTAEFDLESGALKCISILDLHLVLAMRDAKRNTK